VQEVPGEAEEDECRAALHPGQVHAPQSARSLYLLTTMSVNTGVGVKMLQFTMAAGFTVVVLEHVVEDVEWPHRVQPAGKILDADRLCCEGHGGDRSHGDGDDGEEVVDDELAEPGTMP